jgi:hypothetical protein
MSDLAAALMDPLAALEDIQRERALLDAREARLVAAGLLPLRRRDGTVRAFVRVDASDVEHLAQWRWSLGFGGKRSRGAAYAVRTAGSRGHYYSVFMHRELLCLGRGDRRIGDHINGDKLDNRRSNLRIVTPGQNQQNRTALDSRNKSGHRGVCWHAQRQKWRAVGHIAGRSHWLGYFDDVEEAARVVSAWRADNMPFSADARGEAA